MVRPLRYTVLGDGSSDQCLVPIVQWIVDQQYGQTPYAVEYAASKHLPSPGVGLRKRILAAARIYPCDILIVHRDAERQPLAARIAEVMREVEGTTQKCVAAVPVRMTESWLMVDECAIRRAANNPNGTVELDMPPEHRWESLADPKDKLFDLLRTATELNARRLAKFNVYEARARLPGLVSDYIRLRTLTAFREFEKQLLAMTAEVMLARGAV